MEDQHARGRMGIVLTTIVINISAVTLLTVMPWSDWRTGAQSAGRSPPARFGRQAPEHAYYIIVLGEFGIVILLALLTKQSARGN